MSRGLRNNNPGNIRRGGGRFRGERRPSTDPHFKQFESIEWGYRAMFLLLDNYRHRYGLTTLREMISRWAPPIENDTEGYLHFVARSAGCHPTSRVDTRRGEVMCPIVGAMSTLENGVEALDEEVERGWQLFINDKTD